MEKGGERKLLQRISHSKARLSGSNVTRCRDIILPCQCLRDTSMQRGKQARDDKSCIQPVNPVAKKIRRHAAAGRPGADRKAQ
jgi:hypothetical protein